LEDPCGAKAHGIPAKNMPNRKSSDNSLENFKKRFFRTTGISFGAMVKGVAFLAVVLIATTLTVLYLNSEEAGAVSGIEAVKTKELSSEEQFVEVSELPSDFSGKRPVEKIDILTAKMAAGEELAASGGPYAERATDQLIIVYGTLCQLQELEGVDSTETYKKLEKICQQAEDAGNEDRAASADFFRAYAATSRLNRCYELKDFRFATDALLKLDSKNLVNADKVNQLYLNAIQLHDRSSVQDKTALYLSILADKLRYSETGAIASLGLNLKDHAAYNNYYDSVDKQPYTTSREAKLEFFEELFAKIEKFPPQSIKTYQVIFRLLDRLLNKSDAAFASSLTKRLGKASLATDPSIKTKVDQSIKNIETRIALIGKTADLSGSTCIGKPLQLPNGNPTTIVFFRYDNLKSMEYLKSVASSGLYNPWENNMLIACLSSGPADEFEEAARTLGRFTILDYPTAHRLEKEFRLELVPYQVSLDKEGKVVRLGIPVD